MKHPVQKKELRAFGLLVGGVFSVIGVWPTIFSGSSPRVWALGVGGGLILLGLVLPQALRPAHRLWMLVGHVLGWVNTRIILGIIFYGLITPMGFLIRLFGNDAMRRALVQEVETYRVNRQPRSATHVRRQF